MSIDIDIDIEQLTIVDAKVQDRDLVLALGPSRVRT